MQYNPRVPCPLSHTGPVLGNRNACSVVKVPFAGQPISCPTWLASPPTASSHMKHGPVVVPDSSKPAGHTTGPSPRSCSATCHRARGAKLRRSSQAPLRIVNRVVKKQRRITNHIERFNCTLRQRVSRLVRKSLSFSKKLANHIGAIKYFICHYNLDKALHV